MSVLKLYLDMDGVLVHQVGRKRWDLMPWMPDGRFLWDALSKYSPVLLTQLMIDVYEVSRHEKRTWVDRELGRDIECIVVHAEEGKFPYAAPGHVLIDDRADHHKEAWEARGGTFIHHQSAAQTITEFHRIRSKG